MTSHNASSRTDCFIIQDRLPFKRLQYPVCKFDIPTAVQYKSQRSGDALGLGNPGMRKGGGEGGTTGLEVRQLSVPKEAALRSKEHRRLPGRGQPTQVAT